MTKEKDVTDRFQKLTDITMSTDDYDEVWANISHEIRGSKQERQSRTNRKSKRNMYSTGAAAFAAVAVVAAGIVGVMKHGNGGGGGPEPTGASNQMGVTNSSIHSNRSGNSITNSTTTNSATHNLTWSPVGTNASPNHAWGFAQVGATLYAMTDSGVWVLKQGNWSELSGTPTGIVTLATANGMLYAGNHEGAWVYKAGKWELLSGSPKDISTLVTVNGSLYAGINTGSEFQPTNQGVWVYQNNTWSPEGSVPSRVISLIDVNGIQYASMETGVWKYASNQWASMNGSPKFMQALVSLNGVLYAATNVVPQKNFWSYDNGTWQNEGTVVGPYALATFNGAVYAGTTTGISVLENGKWIQQNKSLGNVRVLFANNGTLYAATENNGVQAAMPQ